MTDADVATKVAEIMARVPPGLRQPSEPGTLFGFPMVEVPREDLLARALRDLNDVLARAELAADRRRYNRARRKAVRAVLAGLARGGSR